MKPNFKNSVSGVAAIEFAILLPFLLLVLFGTYEVTNYVTAVRKVDNVTNDIGYILSREGCIATDNSKNGDCDQIETYEGGRTRLENIFASTIPFLMYPYPFDVSNIRSQLAANSASSTNAASAIIGPIVGPVVPIRLPRATQSQIQVKYVGLPLTATTCPATGGPNGDGINRDTARVMWIDRYPANNRIAVFDGEDDNAGPCVGSECPYVCDNSSNGRYNSNYSDSNGNNRANIIYPGQSFIIVDFTYDFSKVLVNNILGLILPTKIQKFASYASRSRINDSSQLVNYMQYCTDCNIASSKYGIYNGMNPGNAVLRQPCTQDTFPPSLALTDSNVSNASGCTFF